MAEPFRIVRIVSDERGETHFSDMVRLPFVLATRKDRWTSTRFIAVELAEQHPDEMVGADDTSMTRAGGSAGSQRCHRRTVGSVRHQRTSAVPPNACRLRLHVAQCTGTTADRVLGCGRGSDGERRRTSRDPCRRDILRRRRDGTRTHFTCSGWEDQAELVHPLLNAMQIVGCTHCPSFAKRGFWNKATQPLLRMRKFELPCRETRYRGCLDQRTKCSGSRSNSAVQELSVDPTIPPMLLMFCMAYLRRTGYILRMRQVIERVSDHRCARKAAPTAVRCRGRKCSVAWGPRAFADDSDLWDLAGSRYMHPFLQLPSKEVALGPSAWVHLSRSPSYVRWCIGRTGALPRSCASTRLTTRCPSISILLLPPRNRGFRPKHASTPSLHTILDTIPASDLDRRASWRRNSLFGVNSCLSLAGSFDEVGRGAVGGMRDAMDAMLRGSSAFLQEREPKEGMKKAQKDKHVRDLKRVQQAVRTCLEKCGFDDVLHGEKDEAGTQVPCSASERNGNDTEDVQDSLERCFEAEKERIRRGMPQMPTKLSIPVDPTQAHLVVDTQNEWMETKENDPEETKECSKGQEEDGMEDEDVVQETPIVKETPLQERQPDRAGAQRTSPNARRKSLHMLFGDKADPEEEQFISEQPTVVSESQLDCQQDLPLNEGLHTRSADDKGQTPDGTGMLSLRIQGTGTLGSEPRGRMSIGTDAGTMGNDGTPMETVKATDPDSALERAVGYESLCETNDESQLTFDQTTSSNVCPAVPVAMMKHEKEVLAVILGGSESDVYAAIVCKGEDQDETERIVFVWQLSTGASVGEPFLLGGDDFVYRGNPDVTSIGLLATMDDVLLVATHCWEHRSIENNGSFCGVGGFHISAEGMSCVFRISCAHDSTCLAVAWNRTLLVGGDEGRISKANRDGSKWNHKIGEMSEVAQAKFAKIRIPRITHLAFVPEQRDIVVGTCSSGSIAVWNYVEGAVLMTAHDCHFLLACLHPVGSLLLQSPSPFPGRQSFGMQCSEESLYPAFFLALVAKRKSKEKAKCRPVWIGNNRVVVGKPICDEPATAVGSCGADGLLAWSDGVVTTWDPDSGEMKSLLEEHAGQEITSIATHHETGIIATATKHGEVVVYSLPV